MKKIIFTILTVLLLQNLLFAQLYVEKQNGKYGYTNEEYDIKIEYIYDEADDFDREWFNLAKVKRNDNYYVIDTLGTEYLLASDINAITPQTKALDLSKNKLEEIPSEVFEYTQLKILLLNNSEITNLPSEIKKLTNLIYLNLTFNQLTSLPPEIENLINLSELYLCINQFEDLPNEIGSLTNLTTLNICENQLTSLPLEIGSLTNLTFLDLQSNVLTSLPPEIGNLKNLIYLNLSYNRLTSLPLEIGGLLELTGLDLQYNNLATLPSEIGNLKNLIYLDLSYNKLTSLPLEIGNLLKLKELDFQHNELTDLPSEITSLTNLIELYLGINNFSKKEKNNIKEYLPDCYINFSRYIERTGLGFGLNYSIGNEQWFGGEISIFQQTDGYFFNAYNFFSVALFTFGYNHNFTSNINDFYFNLAQINKHSLFNYQITKFGFQTAPFLDKAKWYYRPSIGLSYSIFSFSYSYNLVFDKTVRDQLEKHLFEVKISFPIIKY